MACKLKLVDDFLLPKPNLVFIELINLIVKKTILKDFLATMYRTFVSFFGACFFALPLGLFLGTKARIYKSAEILVDFFRSIPATALFPLFLLIFGIGDISKIAVCFFSAFLIILFNTVYGVINCNKHRIITAKVMGATKFQIFKLIIFRESLPQIFIGLKSAVSMCLIVSLVCEMFLGTNFGLGKKIIDYQYVFDIKAMYAVIIIVGSLGYFLNFIFSVLEKKFNHWKQAD